MENPSSMRLFSALSHRSFALVLVGYGLADLVADHIGSVPVFLIGGAISTAIIALGLLHPAVRQLD